MTNILIAGVGGQGSLLTSRILGTVYLSQGFDVKVSEVHGMSQRGGSVTTYVRAGERVDAPLIPEGEVELLIALEQLEALRWTHHVRPGGAVVMSRQVIWPMPVISGAVRYPEGIEDTLKAAGLDVRVADAQAVAEELGHPRVSNVVLLGVCSGLLGFDENVWREALRACVKPAFWEINEEAFIRGRGIVI